MKEIELRKLVEKSDKVWDYIKDIAGLYADARELIIDLESRKGEEKYKTLGDYLLKFQNKYNESGVQDPVVEAFGIILAMQACVEYAIKEVGGRDHE